MPNEASPDQSKIHGLLSKFTFSYLCNVLNVIPAVLLIGLDELIEVPLRPIQEALAQQTVPLPQFLVSYGRGVVDLSLLFLLDVRCVGSEFRIFRNLRKYFAG